MLVLLATAIGIYKGWRSPRIVTLWFIGLVLTVLLFHYHVTSKLDLSF